MDYCKKYGLYEDTTYDHAPRYIMRETATISEWGNCLDDSRSGASKQFPSWVKDQYSSLDKALGFMRDGFFFKPLFELEDNAKAYQFIIDYDDPARDVMRKCHLLTEDGGLNNKQLSLAGFVSSETRTIYRSLKEED